MADPDFTEGWHGLQEDMSAHQRAHGLEVTAAFNAALAGEECRRLEQEAREAPPVPTGAAVPLAPTLVDDAEKTASGETVKRNDKGILAVAEPQTGSLYRQANEREERLLKQIGARVELLMSKRDTGPLGQPSWRDRVLAILYWRSKSAAYWKEAERTGDLNLYSTANDLERRYMFELKQILDESSTTFGDWRKPPDRMVIVGAG